MTVLTDSLPVANHLAFKTDNRVFLTGGEVLAQQGIVLSPFDDPPAFLRRVRIGLVVDEFEPRPRLLDIELLEAVEDALRRQLLALGIGDLLDGDRPPLVLDRLFAGTGAQGDQRRERQEGG